jgi:RHS repeat-associated protein
MTLRAPRPIRRHGRPRGRALPTRYDANGSRTLKDQGNGESDEFVYDARGLLVEVKRWNGTSVTSSQTNLYDYAGTRVVRAPSSGAGTTIRTYNRYADAGGGNLTKYFYLGDRLIGSWSSAYPSLSEVEPGLLVPPAPIRLPPALLLPAAGAVGLLLVLPLGRRRALGVRVSLARSASLTVVFLSASFPVVIVAGCGAPPPVRIFHVDHLGSTQALTDYDGNLYRQVRYFAYGEVRGRFDGAGSPVGLAQDARFEFTGYETDFAGLDYAGARFFDPELAQFASHDPAGQYPSPYAYGPGDPINFNDPTGAFAEIIVFAVFQQIAAAIDAYRETHDSTKAWQGRARRGAQPAHGGDLRRREGAVQRRRRPLPGGLRGERRDSRPVRHGAGVQRRPDRQWTRGGRRSRNRHRPHRLRDPLRPRVGEGERDRNRLRRSKSRLS